MESRPVSRSVAQPGRAPRLGRGGSQVQILPLRPIAELRQSSGPDYGTDTPFVLISSKTRWLSVPQTLSCAASSHRNLHFSSERRSAPILSLPLRPVQPLLIRAAADLTPHWVRTIVGLTGYGLNVWEAGVVRQIERSRIALFLKPIQPSRPVDVSANYLYV